GWKGTFGSIEHGVAIVGMITLSFVLGAWWVHPDWHAVARGFVPHLPSQDRAQYGYLAVSIIGATVSPYLVSFYSSGAIEEGWKTSDLGPNRLTSVLGMSFGSMVAISAVVVSAVVVAPAGIAVEADHHACV